MTLESIINRRILEAKRNSNFNFEDLLNSPNIYAIGKNSESVAISKLLKLKGIIDDFSVNEEWNGIQLLPSRSIPKNALVINCSTSISPVSVKRIFKERGFHNWLDYYDLIQADIGLPKPDFCIETIKDFELNKSNWSTIYHLLSDQKSKKTFEDILLYRLTCNPNYMQNYSVRFKEQYLESFMGYSKEVFADIGGYDGDTTKLFCDKYPDYHKIFLFEPSKSNIKRAKERLALNYRVEFFNLGLSDRKATLTFDDDLGSSSKISVEGKNKINTDTLDNVISDEITFLKMDIEGWEMSALKGAENHIKEEHPKLAIAIYHDPKDFWQVPEFIFSLRNDYEIFVRHYTEGWSETVMYFKPKKIK